MKELLYYQDSMIKEFTADVIKTGTDEHGPYVVLSNTAFYPTGGGQPHDTGWINGIEVLNVEKTGEEIRHYIKETVALSGTVEGKLNWARRFDHMQQHTGQHILTAAFVELFDYQTVSFHLGAELVAIDLNTKEVTAEQLMASAENINTYVEAARIYGESR